MINSKLIFLTFYAWIIYAKRFASTLIISRAFYIKQLTKIQIKIWKAKCLIKKFSKLQRKYKTKCLPSFVNLFTPSMNPVFTFTQSLVIRHSLFSISIWLHSGFCLQALRHCSSPLGPLIVNNFWPCSKGTFHSQRAGQLPSHSKWKSIILRSQLKI